MSETPRRPKIFLSFAGDDRPAARRFSADLLARGVESYLDLRDSRPGDNVPQAIDRALTHSDFYLLLWSRHTVDRAWVNVEWTAAFIREINERRSFLFIARLDETPMPTLLAPRRYLDAFRDWDACVDELSRTWKRDRELGPVVLPPPPVPPGPVAAGVPAAVPAVEAGSEIYLRNSALSMSVVLTLTPETTGHGLWDQVQRELQLKEQISMFQGTVGMRFSYHLRHGRQQIAQDSAEPLRLPDGATVDLVIEVELTSRAQAPQSAQALQSWVWRGPAYPTGEPRGGPSPKIIQTLLDKAFGHLLPDGT